MGADVPVLEMAASSVRGAGLPDGYMRGHAHVYTHARRRNRAGLPADWRGPFVMVAWTLATYSYGILVMAY